MLQRSRLQRGECASCRGGCAFCRRCFNEVDSKEANAPASYQVFVTSVKKPTTARTSSFDMDDVRFVIAMRSQLIDSLTLFRCANLNGKGHHSEFAQNSPIP